MAKGKNVARRHHYVPKFLLKNFVDSNGDLWVYDITHRRKLKRAPGTVALERNFYALPGQTDDAIETFLAQIRFRKFVLSRPKVRTVYIEVTSARGEQHRV